MELRKDYFLDRWVVVATERKKRPQQFKKDSDVKAILSYADNNHHKGTIYRACNFTYYGLTDKKTDFFEKMPDGSFSKVNRGKVKDKEGEWRPRSQKHRFLMIFDKKLKKQIKFKEE